MKNILRTFILLFFLNSCAYEYTPPKPDFKGTLAEYDYEIFLSYSEIGCESVLKIKNNFDFLNIDCEGNDLKILKTIDLKKYTPKIIIIEVSNENKKKIYSYLNLHGYKLYITKSLSHIFKKIEK